METLEFTALRLLALVLLSACGLGPMLSWGGFDATILGGSRILSGLSRGACCPISRCVQAVLPGM